MKRFIYFIMVTSVLLASCQNEPEENLLHLELQEALRQASNTNSTSFFRLPASDDFNAIPQDPKNPLTKDKVELGRLLFHETAFATAGEFPITVEEYSCATCHQSKAGFQAGTAQGLGEGGQGFGLMGEGRTRNLLCDPAKCDVQPVRSPTILNTAFQPLMLWNGQFGSTDQNIGTEANWTEDTPKAINKLGLHGLEVQAIAGLKVHRIAFDESAVTEHGYKEMFDQVFANSPSSERYSIENAGLAIAAYERTVNSYNAPFQKYLRGNKYALSDYQKEGALLFFGKANCVSCHTGPALNKMEFHALGLNEFDVNEVTHYNPEDPAQLGRGSFTQRAEDMYKFKTPSLYNLKDVEFFGHGASLRSIEDVIHYKNKAVAENTNVPTGQLADEFVPLGLTDEEVDKISAFIRYSLNDPDLDRFVPTALLSGNCFPNNDQQSKIDIGCN